MEQKRPGTVLAAKIVSIVSLVVCTLWIALLVWMVNFHPTSPAGRGFYRGFVGTLEKRYGQFNYEVAGMLSAIPLLSMLCSAIVLIALVKRSKAGWWISVIFTGAMIVLGCCNLSFPLFQIACFILLVLPATQNYLKNAPSPPLWV